VSVAHLFGVNTDTTSPNISFSSPTPADGSTVTSLPINIAVTSDASASGVLVFNSINYTLRNSSGGLNATSINYSFSSLTDGTYSYYVVLYNILGNSNTSTTRTVSLDTTSPVITLSPINGSTFSNWIGITLGITTNEASFCNITARRIGTTTTTSTVVLTPSSSANTSFTKTYNSTADSSAIDNYFTVKCSDIFGQATTSTTYFKINDTVAPTVSFINPTPSDDDYVNTNNISLNLSVSETLGSPKVVQLNDTNYTLLGSPDNYYYTFTLLTGTEYTFIAHVNDTKGNFYSTPLRTFKIDITHIMPFYITMILK